MDNELELNDSNPAGKVYFQLALLVLVIFGVAYFTNKHDITEKEEPIQTMVQTTVLPMRGLAINNYPEMKFKSDSKWNAYLSGNDKPIDGRRIEGTGYIVDGSMSVDCILSDGGQLIGRYRHQNGTTLDVNGYIDSETNTLNIKLGHGRELSYLILHPSDEDPTDNQYTYKGTWGKRKRESGISFVFK